MPRFKKKPYEKKKFESTGTSSDISANIYLSMLMSKAWGELTAKQRELYLYCKMQFFAEKLKPIKNNRNSFTMNTAKWHDLYGLYTRKNGFYKDMTALIEHGFIRCLECGAFSRTKSIYEFSDKWQKYGTPEFEILPYEMTRAMNRNTNIPKYFIYRFKDKNENIIYIGKTKLSLERRFNSHKHLPDECYKEIEKIEYLAFNNKRDMDISERYFISKIKPTYNTEYIDENININNSELDSLYNSEWLIYLRKTFFP
jgi:hypothetical protein